MPLGKRMLDALGVAIICAVVGGCASSTAAPTAAPSPSRTPQPAGSVSPVVDPASSALLQAVEALHADEAAVLSPGVRTAARAVKNDQLRAAKALGAYDASLASGCSASTAAFRAGLGQLNASIAAYQRALASANAVRVRLPADAARIVAAAQRARVSTPVDLTTVNKQFAAYQSDAAARAAAAAGFQIRANAAYARCIAKAQRPVHR